jgi:hypothetical protein
MPSFCTNCGAPVTGAFCGKCGKPIQAQGAAAPATPAAPQVPAAAPPAKGGGLGKVLLIIGAFLLFLFVIGVGGAIYSVYWVKKKVSTYASAVSGPSHDQVVVKGGHTCDLLTREDLQQVLGITVEKSAEIMEGSNPGCAYYANPEAFSQLQRMAVEETRKESAQAQANQQPGQKIDNPLELLKHTDQLEGAMKTLTMTQPDKDGKVFSFTLERGFQPGNWTAVRATTAALPGFKDISGVGDRAMVGSFGHALYVLKGSNLITLDLTYVPDSRTRGVDLGCRIASHL